MLFRFDLKSILLVMYRFDIQNDNYLGSKLYTLIWSF